MRRTVSFVAFLALFPILAWGQDEIDLDDLEEVPSSEMRPYKLKLTRYRFKEPSIENGDTVWCYLLPEVVKYRPMVFKNESQRAKYNRLIRNVKRVLPLAQEANQLILETYEVLETLPSKKAKEEHMRAVEKEIKERYTPEMKKLTYSQGKLLIKLIDRECNQTSYEILQAFIGPAKATFYQVFAWTFRASLKKQYDPEGDDRLVERVVSQVELGLL